MALGQELAAGSTAAGASIIAPAGSLRRAAQRGTADEFKADFTAGSGTQTRYERIAGIDATTYYADWAERERKLPGFTTPPLDTPLEIAGHPVVSLWLASSEPDAAVFVYLSEVEADGTCATSPRACCAPSIAPRRRRRATTARPGRGAASPARMPGRCRPASRSSCASPCCRPPGASPRAAASGSRFAGGDADHFVQTPHGRPPVLTMLNGGERASVLELPTAAA